MSTIRDIARLAGVSPATVSRVMNGTARVDIGKYAAGEPYDTDCVFDVELIERETTRQMKGGNKTTAEFVKNNRLNHREE